MEESRELLIQEDRQVQQSDESAALPSAPELTSSQSNLFRVMMQRLTADGVHAEFAVHNETIDKTGDVRVVVIDYEDEQTHKLTHMAVSGQAPVWHKPAENITLKTVWWKVGDQDEAQDQAGFAQFKIRPDSMRYGGGIGDNPLTQEWWDKTGGVDYAPLGGKIRITDADLDVIAHRLQSGKVNQTLTDKAMEHLRSYGIKQVVDSSAAKTTSQSAPLSLPPVGPVVK